MFAQKQQLKPALRRGDLSTDYNRTAPAYSAANVNRINLGLIKQTPAHAAFSEPAQTRQTVPPQMTQPARSIPRPAPAPAPAPAPVAPPPVQLPMPRLEREVQRGQKTPLNLSDPHARLRLCFGWQLNRGDCDPDASAFMLPASGKVLSDGWFVFYGQPQSPDSACTFRVDGRTDRDVIELDLGRLDRAITRIAFVVTINEALEKNQNFSMLRDLYVRVLDAGSNRELVSFRPEGCFAQVTSMTVCELYLHNGQWKFNPVGNGVHQDLAGQCAVYGVDIG